jgi:hypothetical protein
MSIPLVQNNEKDSINTSIIAIKRNIERINMLLGLVDNDSPDLSGFATKQELQDAVTELQPVDEVTVGNMQSVTSNAVAVDYNKVQKSLSYETTEIIETIGTYYQGKHIYKALFLSNNNWGGVQTAVVGTIPAFAEIISIRSICTDIYNNVTENYAVGTDYHNAYCTINTGAIHVQRNGIFLTDKPARVFVIYSI